MWILGSMRMRVTIYFFSAGSSDEVISYFSENQVVFISDELISLSY
jgi:hypothetical protein